MPSRFVVPFLVLLVLVAAASPAGGQAQLLGSDSRATQVIADCRVFVRISPEAAERSKVLQQRAGSFSAAALEKCLLRTAAVLKQLASELDTKGAPPPAQVSIPEVDPANGGNPALQPISRLNLYLLREHLNLKALEEWVKDLAERSPADPALDRLLPLVEQTRGQLEELLALRGLRELFSAALISGAVVSTGKPVNASSGGEQSADALAHIVWESKHFGDDRFEHWDFAFGGKFGFMPSLTFVTEEGDSGSAEDAQGVYQEAFVWDITGRANFRLSGTHAAEVSLFGRVGQTVLGTQSVLLDRGPNSVLAVPVNNGTTSAEMSYEAGVQYVLYNNPLEVVHGEGSMVSPTFHIGVSLRNDSRFKKDGALAVFDDPERRIVFRFMVDALKVIDRRQIAEPQRVFTFGFGVEHEAAMPGDALKLPSGTKLVFRGDIDLLRALRGR
jgi:hypothetical protein